MSVIDKRLKETENILKNHITYMTSVTYDKETKLLM